MTLTSILMKQVDYNREKNRRRSSINLPNHIIHWAKVWFTNHLDYKNSNNNKLRSPVLYERKMVENPIPNGLQLRMDYQLDNQQYQSLLLLTFQKLKTSVLFSFKDLLIVKNIWKNLNPNSKHHVFDSLDQLLFIQNKKKTSSYKKKRLSHQDYLHTKKRKPFASSTVIYLCIPPHKPEQSPAFQTLPIKTKKPSLYLSISTDTNDSDDDIPLGTLINTSPKESTLKYVL